MALAVFFIFFVVRRVLSFPGTTNHESNTVPGNWMKITVSQDSATISGFLLRLVAESFSGSVSWPHHDTNVMAKKQKTTKTLDGWIPDT